MATTRQLVLWLTLALAACLPLASAGIFSDSVLRYCKCTCFSNFTIIPLYHPEDTSKPCLSCTRKFCIEQELEICKGAELPPTDTDTGTGTEGDVLAVCFKRDSPRDQVIVTSFVLIVCGLLLYAGVRSKLRRAIEERGQPTDLRGWGEALLPRSVASSVLPQRMSNGRYAPVSVGS